MIRRFSAMARTVIVIALAGVLSGCTSGSLLKAQEAFRHGDVDLARTHIDRYVAKDGSGKDRIIAHLEQGLIRRAGGDIEGSNESLGVADEAIDSQEDQPDVSISRETLAATTNLNMLPYRGTNYDRIMLSTYRALNDLDLGNKDAARVELQRAYERQREAVQRNQKRIEKAEEAATKNDANDGSSYDVNRAKKDARFNESLKAQYGDLDRYQAYADYVNPFCEWLQGVYFMAEGADGADLERARKSMERVTGMVPDNPFAKQDLATLEQASKDGTIPAVTYVVFATGTAPRRGQIRIDIPLFLVTDQIDYVGVNFPRLIESNDYLTPLQIDADSQTVSTSLLCDMDAVVGQEFHSDLPVIITKTLISAGTKALIAHGLREATKRQDSWLAIGTRVAATIGQAALNQADLRTWNSLPKQFQYARFPTPASGSLALRSRTGTVPVSVEPGRINVVMVRSINGYAPLQVSRFVLGKPAGADRTTSTAATSRHNRAG